MSPDDPRALLRPLLARRLSPADRRALAAALRAIADEQTQLAEADEHIGHIVRRVQLDAAPRKGGRPRGSGARFVRWEPPTGEGASRRSGKLFIGRALWQELGEPARMDVQRHGAAVVLRPCGAGAGWAISRSSNAMPALNIGEDAADALRLVPGRWEATIQGGVIVAQIG